MAPAKMVFCSFSKLPGTVYPE